ncbi:MAG: Type 1 glutamine amidotransferase-like domain-containing protein [Candidatus Staskawiczbacteria bacterium]|jgi:dipeptidase E
MNKLTLFLVIFLFSLSCFFVPSFVLAHQPAIIYTQAGDIQIKNPELSQAFYDELRGVSRDYFIDSDKDFVLYINLLVPAHSNIDGRYSVDVFSAQGEKIYSLDGSKFDWQQFYEEFSRDYYFKGPELEENVLAGKYKITVYSSDNLGKYVLTVGKTESFDVQSILNIYWQLPLLKVVFFKTSVLQFFLTPFGIAGVGVVGALLIIIALINYLIGLVKNIIKHNMAKTLLLTSTGMVSMRDEITKLLTKPAYDITVAFITTAAKPQENLDYLKNDLIIMRDEMGFNVEEIDIDGKKESEVMSLIEMKDIIFVAGGNTFYLLKSMRACNFERIIKKLLKEGKVYIGVSAGSMVAGKTIQTAGWGEDGDKNIVKLKNLKGLGLVPFDIFCHYLPEHAEIIKQKIKNPKKRFKNLKIITDEQAILVQGKETDLIGRGEAVVI